MRFGATITFAHVTGPRQGTSFTFTITGVDEASVKDGRIAFTSPMARALMGRRMNDEASVPAAGTTVTVRVLAVRYLPDTD